MDTAGSMAYDTEVRGRRSHWLYRFEGITLVLLGIVAMAVPAIATLAFEMFFGALLLLSGILGTVTVLSNRQSTGFAWSLVSALLAIVAGALLLRWPLGGAVSLTVVLVLFFFLEGFASIMLALAHRRDRTGSRQWMLARGVMDLVLAGVILTGFPGTSMWAIGVLLGINMIFGGSALFAMATQGTAGGTGAATRGS